MLNNPTYQNTMTQILLGALVALTAQSAWLTVGIIASAMIAATLIAILGEKGSDHAGT